jgi:hypothetical protein
MLLYMLGATLIRRDIFLSFAQMERESFCAGTIASCCNHIADHRGKFEIAETGDKSLE